jgi:predicted DNA-binding protein
MEERLEALAKSKRVTFSAAMRFALERGVAALESEALAPPVLRRKVLSRGVG